MSEIFEKNGNRFRRCLYCGQDILIHSNVGAAFAVAAHNHPETDALCFDCATKIGAARGKRDYDEDFIFDGRLFVQYSDYWLTWRSPAAGDFDELNLRDYGPASLSNSRSKP